MVGSIDGTLQTDHWCPRTGLPVRKIVMHVNQRDVLGRVIIVRGDKNLDGIRVPGGNRMPCVRNETGIVALVDPLKCRVCVFLEGDHPYESDHPYWAGEAWFPGDWVHPLLTIDHE